MNKRLGQHFLINESVPKKIIKALDLQKGDVVIEIGPGTGALTFPLLDKCNEVSCKLIAIEKDKTLAHGIQRSVDNKNLEIIIGDALKELPEITKSLKLKAKSYKIVGNIPYYITGKLLRVISELSKKPENTILMIQREVAERICAEPRKMNPVRGHEGSSHANPLRDKQHASNGMNLLAAATQIWAEPKILFNLVPADFDPPPQVYSATIQLKNIDNKMTPEKIANYYKSLRIIFKQPRKTLFNNLREGMTASQKDIEIGLNKLKIDPQSRPQNLSIGQIKELANIIY